MPRRLRRQPQKQLKLRRIMRAAHQEMEAEVLSILQQSKVSYPILRYTSEFDRFQTGYVPTTIFVDNKGHIVKMSDGTDSVIGSQSYEAWEAIVKQYL